MFFCTSAVTTSAFSYEIVVSRLYSISFDTKSRPTGNSEIKIECLKKTWCIFLYHISYLSYFKTTKK